MLIFEPKSVDQDADPHPMVGRLRMSRVVFPAEETGEHGHRGAGGPAWTLVVARVHSA